MRYSIVHRKTVWGPIVLLKHLGKEFVFSGRAQKSYSSAVYSGMVLL